LGWLRLPEGLPQESVVRFANHSHPVVAAEGAIARGVDRGRRDCGP